MRIENFIPKGKENAISRAALCISTGRCDRENRHMIQVARDRGIPIVASKAGGYYIADNALEIKHIQNDYRHRAYKMLETARRLNGAQDSFQICLEG
jgi:hypothetical protein